VEGGGLVVVGGRRHDGEAAAGLGGVGGGGDGGRGKKMKL
jgi:hypothetical protein